MSGGADVALEGLISVKAALRAGSRPIERIFVDQSKADRAISDLLRIASEAGVAVERVSRDTIDAMASGRTHGGVLALAGERRYEDVASLALPKNACVAVLEGIEDPYNFGFCVRSLYAAGVSGLIVPPREWRGAEGVVARSSAGASELMPTAVAADPGEVVRAFVGQGYQIACALKASGAISLYDASFRFPLLLTIGGEKRGISRAYLDHASLLVKIPYARAFSHALPSAAATSVLAFEAMRQAGAFSGR